MKSLICLSVLALAFGFAQSASAGTRLEEGAMGAAAGALVGGPIGAVAGGAVGYTEGHSIARGLFHHGHRRYYWRHGHRHYYR